MCSIVRGVLRAMNAHRAPSNQLFFLSLSSSTATHSAHHHSTHTHTHARCVFSRRLKRLFFEKKRANKSKTHTHTQSTTTAVFFDARKLLIREYERRKEASGQVRDLIWLIKPHLVVTPFRAIIHEFIHQTAFPLINNTKSKKNIPAMSTHLSNSSLIINPWS